VTPRALEVGEIASIVEDYAKATANAKAAGFDGVELHGSNLFLVPQFLHESTNRRSDAYGGSPANRARFVTEVLSAMAAAWDHERVGIKLSPTVSGVGEYAAVDYLLQWLSDFEPAYLHMRRGFDANHKPIETLKEHAFDHYRERYKGRLIGNGAFDLASANDHIARGAVDLVSFATHYIANPDLVARFRDGHPLAQPDVTTFYQGGARGFVDYTAFAGVTAGA
jgi:N-ethylmaleimide reductase